MGLLEKAKGELEAGRSPKGPGLFAKALQARTVVLPTDQKPVIERILPVSGKYPLSQAELSSLADEIKALGQTEDAILAAYVRIHAALPLSALALLIVNRENVIPCGVKGFAPRAASEKPVTRDILPSILNGQALSGAAKEAISAYLGEAQALPVRAFVRTNERKRFSALWLYADDRIGQDGNLVMLLARIFESAPLPLGSIEIHEAVSPALAALRLPLGSGKAVVFRFDLGNFLSQCLARYPELRQEAFMPVLAECFADVLGSDGKVFCLEGQRIAAVLYSKEKTDCELALVQLRKSIKRALPFLAAVNFPEGRAIGVDLASSGALESFERFCSD